MKISYILQLKDFFILFGSGIALGIIYEILNIHNKIKPIFILQILTDIIFSITSVTSFLILINIINYGEFRLFLLIGYTLGFILEKITLGKLFAKIIKYMYNKVVKLLKLIIKSKFIKVLFK